MSGNHNKHKESEFIESIKTEIDIVFNQMHIRMTHKYTISSISAVIAGAIITFSDISENSSSTSLILIGLTTSIFCIFALLISREDSLLVSHDMYVYKLRQRLVIYFNSLQEPEVIIYGFLDSIKSDKEEGLLNSFLTVSIYFTAIIPAVINFIIFGEQYYNKHHNEQFWSWDCWSLLGIVIMIINFISILWLFWILINIRKKITRNEAKINNLKKRDTHRRLSQDLTGKNLLYFEDKVKDFIAHKLNKDRKKITLNDELGEYFSIFKNRCSEKLLESFAQDFPICLYTFRTNNKSMSGYDKYYCNLDSNTLLILKENYCEPKKLKVKDLIRYLEKKEYC